MHESYMRDNLMTDLHKKRISQASKRKSVLLDSSSEDEKKGSHGQNRRSSSEVFEASILMYIYT